MPQRPGCCGAHLHATQSDPHGGGGALLALADVHGLLFLRGVVPVLARAHLQVQHARHRVSPRQVLQQDEFWEGSLGQGGQPTNGASLYFSTKEDQATSSMTGSPGRKDTVLVALLGILLHLLQVLLMALEAPGVVLVLGPSMAALQAVTVHLIFL